MIALVTGAGGLVGSACVSLLCEQDWSVVGIDNNMRKQFFGIAGSTESCTNSLLARFPKSYQHHWIDIRDRERITQIIQTTQPHFIIHTAAQPSHDKAASIPYQDFEVNAVGTLNLLQTARTFCPDTPFAFTSTNKVYGDRPNDLLTIELPTRYDYIGKEHGVDERMEIDQCLHSLFGASKLAADILCQEYGRYFGMPVGVFRCGCLTGPLHASVELHGYLSYIVHCAVAKKHYTVYGYKGKQVRDQLHARDVAALFLEFFENPRCGEVYNLGGGRENSVSIIETIRMLEGVGYSLTYSYDEHARMGDHKVYISDLTKIRDHFPDWTPQYNLSSLLFEIVEQYEENLHHVLR